MNIFIFINNNNKKLFLGPSNKSNSQLITSSSNDDDDDKQSEQVQSLTQLVLSLDMEQWENLVQVFDLKKPMIRNEN